VKILLALKADYKATTGQDWKPGAAPPAPKQEESSSGAQDPVVINDTIVEQGNKVRDLKAQKAPKVLKLLVLVNY
jgi:bifunctional glutamyl/prolyl-tRNA synthetase